MNHLGYSYLEPLENNEEIRDELDKLPQNIDQYVSTNNTFYNIKDDSDSKIANIKNMKMENDYINRDNKPNKKLEQRNNDYYSIILQEKFVLALGGLTLISLVILNSRL